MSREGCQRTLDGAGRASALGIADARHGTMQRQKDELYASWNRTAEEHRLQ